MKKEKSLINYYSEADEILMKFNLYENQELTNYIFNILNHSRSLEDKINSLNQQLTRKEEELNRYKAQNPNFYHDCQIIEKEFPSFNFPILKKPPRPNPHLNYFNQNNNPCIQNNANKNNYYENNNPFSYQAAHIPNAPRSFNQNSNPRNSSFNFKNNFHNQNFPIPYENSDKNDPPVFYFNQNNSLLPQQEIMNKNNHNYFKKLKISNEFEKNHDLHLTNIPEEERKEVKKEENFNTALADSLYAEKLQLEEYNSTEKHARNHQDNIDVYPQLFFPNNEYIQHDLLGSPEINIPQEKEEIHGLRSNQINRLITRKEVKKENLNLNIQCNICLQSYDISRNYCKMDCTHCFHKECIAKWLKTKAICPICKFKFR